MTKFDACLAVGQWSKEYYLYYGARPERVFLVPHVVDSSLFRTEASRCQTQRVELRKRWGLREKSTVFLFAGKFIPKKRPMDFIRAIDLAARVSRNVVGLMVGDGPLRPACEAFVQEKRTPVRFAGFLNQSQIVGSYVAADALVLPSDGETWGLVVNEGMASGTPAIVSNQVGCSPDLIEPGVTGDLYPMGDIEGLASTMTRWSDPEQCRVARVAVQEKIAEYSVARAVNGTLAALGAVLASRKLAGMPFGVERP